MRTYPQDRGFGWGGLMWWIVGFLAVVTVMGSLEWRSWNKPSRANFFGAHDQALYLDRSDVTDF